MRCLGAEEEAGGPLELARGGAGLADHHPAEEHGGEEGVAGGGLDLLDHIVVVRHKLAPAPATPLLLQDIMGSRGDPSRARRAALLRNSVTSDVAAL